MGKNDKEFFEQKKEQQDINQYTLCRAPHIQYPILLRLIIFMYKRTKTPQESVLHMNGFLRLWYDHRRAIIIIHYDLRSFSPKNDDFILWQSWRESRKMQPNGWNGSTHMNMNKPRQKPNSNSTSTMSEWWWANEIDSSRVFCEVNLNQSYTHFVLTVHGPCALFRTDGPKQIIKWQKVLKTRASNDKNSSLVFAFSLSPSLIVYKYHNWNWREISLFYFHWVGFFFKRECDICKQ